MKNFRVITISFFITVFILLIQQFWPYKEHFNNDAGAQTLSHTSVIDKNNFITCQFIKTRDQDFLRYHYLFDKFDKELSERTFDTYFKLLDPHKIYFYASDILSFNEYRQTLGDYIQKGDCSFIEKVQSVYKKRMDESILLIKDILKTPFNYTIDEFLETDRKKITWSQSQAESKERLRKILKFFSLHMKDDESDRKTDERLLKKYEMIRKDLEQETPNEKHGKIINAFALSLDPHSSYLLPSEQDQFKIDFNLKLVGIGATLLNIDGYTTIDSIIPGGAAYHDKTLKKGDKIIAVDSGDGQGSQDVVDMRIDKVVQLIRGKENTKVKLSILRKLPNGSMKRFELSLIRTEIQVKEGQAKSDILIVNNKKIGVINLPSFYIDYGACRKDPKNCRSSANDMRREIEALKSKKVDGIVIDLRRNGGGDLLECAKITGLFIKKPIVVQIEGKYRDVNVLEEPSQPVFEGPVAVLISKLSASASEIFAGAIQDYGRGLILGDSRTFGKGTVQSVIDLPGSGKIESAGSLHVTIAKFFLASGRSNQERGVLSDITIPDITESLEISEQMTDYPLPYTVIKPAKDFRPMQNLDAVIARLKEQSQTRIKNSKEFQVVLNDIQEAKREDASLVSLKEKPKKKEAKESEAKKKKIRGKSTSEVILDSDIQLREAGYILLDFITPELKKESVNKSDSKKNNLRKK